MPKKSYLGDGVYVDVENGMLKLTTENGVEADNVIYLEPQVYESLIQYVSHLKQKYHDQKT